MLRDNFDKSLQAINLSYDTVPDRIDHIAIHLPQPVSNKSKFRNKLCSIKLDEATNSKKTLRNKRT